MKVTLKSTFGAMFDGFGQQRSGPMASLESAAHLAWLFASLKIDLVVDIGAESGQFGTFLRNQVGYAGRIASFEAVPAPFDALKSRAARDDFWEVEQSSLGAQGGELPLNVIDLGQFRAAGAVKAGVPPRRIGSGGFLRRTIQVRREIVPIRTLDQALPPLMARFDARRVFLKLNARDHDRDVLKGAEKSLGRIVALQTELSTNRRQEGMPHYLAMLSFFEAKHFSPNGFFPIMAGAASRVTFDCCLVNTSYA